MLARPSTTRIVTIVTVIAGRAQTRHGASAGSKRVAGRLASAIRDFINASDIGVRAERDLRKPDDRSQTIGKTMGSRALQRRKLPSIQITGLDSDILIFGV